MSLIADALKEAQREREQPDRRREDVVRRIVAGDGRRIGSNLWIRGPRPRVPASLTVAIALFVTALVGATGFVSWSAHRAAPPSRSGAIVNRLTNPSPRVVASMSTVQRVDSLVRSTQHPPAPTPTAATVARAASVAVSPPVTRGGTHQVGTRATAPSAPAPAPPASSRPPASQPAAAQQSFRLVLAPPRQAADDLFRQGVEAQRRRDFASAVELYRGALARDPDNAEISNNLGICYQALGRLTAARDAFRSAVTLQPRYAVAWSNLGGVLVALGQIDDAQTALAEAVRREPGSTGAKVNLALVFQKQGLLADSERLLREALAIDAGMSEAHYALGQLLEQQGNVREAMEHYRLFLSIASGRFPQQEAALRQRLEHLGRAVGP